MVTSLNILLYVLKTIEVVAVLAIILIGIDLAVYLARDGKPAHKKTGAIKNKLKVLSYKTKTSVDRLLASPKKFKKERAKAKLRKAKEREAYESFFEESYVRGFDSNGTLFYRGMPAPTEKARVYYRMMDKLADQIIFDNTEVL